MEFWWDSMELNGVEWDIMGYITNTNQQYDEYTPQ